MSGLQLQLDCAGADGFRLQLREDLPGEGITAIHGPSGSGKTTLLECVAGLRDPGPGSEIRWRNQVWHDAGGSLPPWERRCGVVFQDARLFPHLNVQDNLEYARKRRRGAAGPELAQVADWLQLTDLLERDSASLSAGQKQRAAIARALLGGPGLLLLDEPLANLDKPARQQCLHLLLRLKRELGLPMLFVSHDIEETSQLADHLLLLEAGTVSGRGPMVELSSRLDTSLAQEDQAAAILCGKVRDHDEAFGLTRLEVAGQPLYVRHLPEAPGQERRLRIPARDVSVCRQRPADSSILNILPVRLCEIRASTPSRALLRLALGEQYLLAQVTRKSISQLGLAPGDQLFAQIKSVALLSEARE